MPWQTRDLKDAAVVTAPDGSAVHILAAAVRGSMAQFTLPAGAVSRAMAHHTVEELWFFTAGRGRMWRRAPDGTEEVAESPRASRSPSLPVRAFSSAPGARRRWSPSA